jgi:hypothetical protein
MGILDDLEAIARCPNRFDERKYRQLARDGFHFEI